MSSSQKPKPQSAQQPVQNEHQKFVMATMKRGELKAHPFNPRKIDDNARKKLKKNIERVGLIEPVVWNKRTGNIVSGHQRLSILDSLQRNENYLLQVAVVDMDEKTEKEQLIFMNNEFAQGNFDLGILGNLMPEIDFSNCGFDEAELSVMLPAFAPQRTEEETAQTAEVKTVAQDVKALKQARKAAVAISQEKHPEDKSVEFFVVLVFPNEEATDQFLDMAKLDRGQKYISGVSVMDMLKKHSGNQ